jgi:hypothetical protein
MTKKAEGTGLEPATPCGASDFESDSSPFGYPPGSNVAVSLALDKAFELRGLVGSLMTETGDGSNGRGD